MGNEKLMWVVSIAFTGIHHGAAITEEEYQERLALLEEYKEEIAQTRKIIAAIDDYQTWPYEKQVNYAVASILSLREKKSEESMDFSDCALTKEEQVARVQEALDEIRQFEDCAKGEAEVQEIETYEDCAKNTK